MLAPNLESASRGSGLAGMRCPTPTTAVPRPQSMRTPSQPGDTMLVTVLTEHNGMTLGMALIKGRSCGASACPTQMRRGNGPGSGGGGGVDSAARQG